MTQFLEHYFNFIALVITLLTSVIFVTFMLLIKRLAKGNDNKLHIGGLITLIVYEVLQILLLIFVATNVILRSYSIFLGVSLGMMVYVGFIYVHKYLRLKLTKKDTETTEEDSKTEELETEPVEA